VAIPAGDVGGAQAAQVAGFDDDILEDFVEGGADMHVAIGERRAVVQNELVRALPGLLEALVKPAALPFFEPLRFARDELRFHGEIGARQIQSIFVVHLKAAKAISGLR
jgi:hypothetical protein